VIRPTDYPFLHHRLAILLTASGPGQFSFVVCLSHIPLGLYGQLGGFTFPPLLVKKHVISYSSAYTPLFFSAPGVGPSAIRTTPSRSPPFPAGASFDDKGSWMLLAYEVPSPLRFASRPSRFLNCVGCQFFRRFPFPELFGFFLCDAPLNSLALPAVLSSCVLVPRAAYSVFIF